ncbi:NAD(P)-dependent dehydrogenase (short-subunit alcohol dehydrogenase family) [Streptomyces sp. V4I2]|nr:NAD(P)-dependent dehydrogenase (short-subunit alcohol dehydrogenase family) [Streptomyces sp. V4I2]
MHLDLTGRAALVTGSSQGIGAAIAAGLARAGARVGVNGRRADRLDKSVDELRSQVPDGEFVPVAADLGTEEGAAGAVDALPDVDILVNNLGIFGPRPALEISDDEWRRYRDSLAVHQASARW